jgi:thiosulfate/3-mercaptopyruvate sulfurtransferase
MSAGNLVGAEWLARHLSEPDLVIADCRFDLANAREGRRQYEQGHIPGALYLDLDKDLSSPKQAHGGRHPLPDLGDFVRKLSALGIDHEVTVVAYDDQRGSMAAARLWWMLRFLGHGRAKVLDGGWSAWRRGGYPETAGVRAPRPRTFVPRIRREMLIDVDELRLRLRETSQPVIDTRATERYRGEVEPLDPVAGHIPGAANIPWTETVDDAGLMRPSGALRELFRPVMQDSVPPVLHCGSGVSACVSVLAMEEAGIPGARLYLGGWSDWCSYPENPVATAKGGR